MCSLHLTHPSEHTPGAVGSRSGGVRGAVEGSVPRSRVASQSFSTSRFTLSRFTLSLKEKKNCYFTARISNTFYSTKDNVDEMSCYIIHHIISS